MRTLKFRAWDGERIIDFFENTRYYINPTDGCVMDNKWGEFKDWKVMQYTGLKDKNNTGEELFEGDVVYIAGYGNYVCEFPFIELYLALSEQDVGDKLGDIYRNPELLEE